MKQVTKNFIVTSLALALIVVTGEMAYESKVSIFSIEAVHGQEAGDGTKKEEESAS